MGIVYWLCLAAHILDSRLMYRTLRTTFIISTLTIDAGFTLLTRISTVSVFFKVHSTTNYDLKKIHGLQLNEMVFFDKF